MIKGKQRVYWQQDFVKSDQLYLLDGARVLYDEQPGILYEHQLIRDNMPILEKAEIQFQNLPVGETVEFTLNSKDNGLFSFLEIRFFKRGKLIASFSQSSQKSVKFEIPEYDDFSVRIRVHGGGSTRLLSVTARIISLEGLIFAGDRALSERIGVVEVAGSAETLLVSFSNQRRYLTAEFFAESGPQAHFASLDGQFDAKIISEFLQQKSQKKFKIFQGPSEILSNLTEYATITTIE